MNKTPQKAYVLINGIAVPLSEADIYRVLLKANRPITAAEVKKFFNDKSLESICTWLKRLTKRGLVNKQDISSVVFGTEITRKHYSVSNKTSSIPSSKSSK